MKVVHISDLHLNKSTYKGVKDKERQNLPFRTVDWMKAFEWMVTESIENIKPDLVTIPGDVYDYYEPTNEVRGFFSQQLSRLTKEGVPVIILVGNHDICQKHHALQGIRDLDLKNIKVIENPTILKFKDIQFFMLPYSIDVERGHVSPIDEFYQFMDEIKEKADGSVSMFLGHFGVRGAKINEYAISKVKAKNKLDVEEVEETEEVKGKKVVKKAFLNKSTHDISVDDLNKLDVDYIILGDYHKHQILPTKNNIAMYTGSIERTDFSEKDDPKGFILYDSDLEKIPGYGQCRFIPYPNCRPMLELSGTLEEMQTQFDRIDYADYQNAIVKITFKGDSEQLTSYSVGNSTFKQNIKEKINPVHIDSHQKVKNEEQEQKAQELQLEIENAGHIGAQEVIDVIKEIIRHEKTEDEKECSAIIDLASEIFEESRSS
jgi:exonuclease SbcD